MGHLIFLKGTPTPFLEGFEFPPLRKVISLPPPQKGSAYLAPSEMAFKNSPSPTDFLGLQYWGGGGGGREIKYGMALHICGLKND